VPLPSPKSRPTQKDVAQLVQVSQATVSLVLNGVADSSVPPVTQRKVLQAAKNLGYVPNRVAQSLRTQRTKTIACIVPDITNPFYPALERGAQNGAEARGYDVLIYNTDGLPAKERKCLDRLLEGRVDGVIGVFFHLTARDLRPLLERKIAVVRIEAGRKNVGPWALDNLFVDNVSAAKAAVQYLVDQGHRKIVMLAGSAGPDSARVRGYKEALRSKKISPEIVSGREFSEQQGYESTRRVLKRSTRPTAIFAGNDMMAIGAVMAVRKAGLKVPDEVAIVGFDDISIAALISPPLTTVSQFQQKLGERAVEMLLERLTGKITGPGRREEMPFKLVVRKSA
jgi:LacI family transcriptional regulator